MSVLEIKQGISRLSLKERREIEIYLLQLKRKTPAWKKSTAKRIKEMQGGKFTEIGELEERYARGE
ncbi:hypothetical protein [Actomonas aquatica]|uniref:DUF2281 domain-containing protein n=1 Tax=Actomonas aquatica TaxID=2866162 RepID=A0ABZ1CB41_9BACT|nr:hypothetical protein [Opitutus sp. WL0086]WRQ88595.1 hypothetical protein K1X11_004210 [Opitutus sp. WL0086]